MSYDLQIIAKKQPKAAHLEAFLEAADAALTADGRLKRDGYLLLTDAAGVHAEVDGPNHTEDEDVPEAAAGAIGATGWLVQISVKPSTDATWPQELAIHLARAADGVVYDPQQDLVTWPKGFQPRNRETGDVRIEQIALDWFTPWPSDDPQLPPRLLQLLEEHCPEALPKRYGGFEPLPYRFEGEHAAESFADRWLEESVSWSAGISWTTTRPCFGGSAGMSSPRAPQRERAGEACVRIGLGFDGRAFARDPAYTERIVELFRAVASELQCVYAAASVERGVIAKRSSFSADYLTEVSPMPRADRWIGLPASPTWLAWFGKPYAELVRPSVAGHITAETDGALFLRMGPEPMNADELADRFPPLPTNLITHRKSQPAEWFPNGSYTLTAGPPSQPAEEIPPVTAGAPLAIDLLRSVLEGLNQLFAEAEIVHWRDRVRAALDAPDAASTADAYLSLSGGSAAGTFHDLIISLFNRHAVTERQEPWINELLTTFQSIGLQAARAISDGGPSAMLPTGVEEAAARHAHIEGDVPPRTRIHVTGMRCTTCDSRFMLDSAIDWAAATRWSLFTAPARIATGRSASLVTAAFDPDADPAARAEVAGVRPAIDELKLPAIRLPYNRPDRGPNDHCTVCGADTWVPIRWQLDGDPPKLVPLQ